MYNPLLTSVSLQNLNIPKCTSFYRLFRECSSLRNVDLTGISAPLLTNGIAMFEMCTSLVNGPSLPISTFTNLSWMFNECRSLTSLPTFNSVGNVVNIETMYRNCTALQSLDLSEWRPISLQNASYMCEGCINMVSANISNWNSPSLTNLSYAFLNCIKLTTLTRNNFTASTTLNDYNMLYGTPIYVR